MEDQSGVYNMYEAPFSSFDPMPSGEVPAVAMQRSTHLQTSGVSELFFGANNIEVLQRRLRREIARLTGYGIDRQSEQQLLIVMRYVYMQSSRHVGGAGEVARLNELVLAEIVPQVGAGLAQYMGYLRDASTLPSPMDRGQATSIKGSKTVQMFRGL